MRIYEGSPRERFQEVLRSIGAFLDQRGMREVLLVEAPDGFIVQGLVSEGGTQGTWSEAVGRQVKETLTFLDDDIARFMDEALGRRGAGTDGPDWSQAGYYERAFRVLGRWIDEQRPRDIFFLEQGGAFVVRLHVTGSGALGGHHELAEFTKDDIEQMVANGPMNRKPEPDASARITPGR
jgi:hypothetical protein